MLTLLFHIITTNIWTFIISVHELYNPHVVLGCRQPRKPVVHCGFQLIISWETFSAQEVFQLREKVKVAGSKVRTVWWMIKNLPTNIMQHVSGCSSCVRTGIVVKQQDTVKKAFHVVDFVWLGVTSEHSRIE